MSEVEERLARLAQGLVDRGLGGPLIVVLEAIKPLSTVVSQWLVFLAPVGEVFFENIRELAVFLEKRDNIERLLLLVEERLREKEETC